MTFCSAVLFVAIARSLSSDDLLHPPAHPLAASLSTLFIGPENLRGERENTVLEEDNDQKWR